MFQSTFLSTINTCKFLFRNKIVEQKKQKQFKCNFVTEIPGIGMYDSYFHCEKSQTAAAFEIQ